MYYIFTLTTKFKGFKLSCTYNQLVLNYFEQVHKVIHKSDYISALENYHQLIEQFEQKISGDRDNKPVYIVQALLEFFYVEQVFSLSDALSSSNAHSFSYAAQSQSSQCSLQSAYQHRDFDVIYCLKFHSGERLTLAFLIVDLLENFNVDSVVINHNNQILVKIKLATGEYIFIAPESGISLDWQEVVQYLSIEGQIESPDDCDSLSQDELIYGMLVARKLELIDAQKYYQALHYIEILLLLEPDNPYEIKDRGFLLQQLNCHKYAKTDFEYFIEQCPDDPVTGLLKQQIDNMPNVNAVVH